MESVTGTMLLSLLIIFAAGKLAGEIFERLRQPAVIGELLAGVIIGPGVLAIVKPDVAAETVATLGVIVLMFAVGLETRPSDMFKVGRTAAIVAVLGVIVPMAAGYGVGSAFGFARPEALFLGTALVATSVGITARVLSDRGLISTRMANIILAAAVIDDILGMLVLSAVTGVVRGGVDVVHIGVIFLQAAIFIGFEVFIAPRIVNKHAHWLDKLHIPNAPLVVSIIVMLGMAALSEWIGLAGIVGAFFAGMMFAETSDRFELEKQVKPLYEWLVPYFFVLTGMKVDPAVFMRPEVLVPGLTLVVLAVATKVIGCGLGALGGGVREAFAIGVGMVPRGEVGLIVASVGLGMGIVSPTVYAVVVLVVVATTLLVPPLLPWVFEFAREGRPGARPEQTPSRAVPEPVD